MKRALDQAIVIARRDFTAIVLTPTFLIFLFAPLLMFGVATLGGLGAARVVEGQRARTVILAGPDQVQVLRKAERRLRSVTGVEPGPPELVVQSASGDPHSQAKKLLQSREAVAVMFGPAGARRIIHQPDFTREANYLVMINAAQSVAPPTMEPVRESGGVDSPRNRGTAAFGAVFLMFLLSLILASQAVSTLAEERNNKVIEILAAAVPLESVFLGKLLGLLGVALVFSAFWGTIGFSGALWSLGAEGIGRVLPDASLPLFAVVYLAYFMLSFLLLGAVFLGVGAQAGTMREVQMLSLPVTIFQVGMFALASAAAGDPYSAVGRFAAIFPFSSPFAMAARAANGVPLWQHLAALAWQLIWLALTITVAARLFRRGVLKSGGGR